MTEQKLRLAALKLAQLQIGDRPRPAEVIERAREYLAFLKEKPRVRPVSHND